MKKPNTRFEKLQKNLSKINHALNLLEKEKEQKDKELDAYCRRHRLNFDNLKTGNIGKLKKIYAYFDSKYTVEWEGGLRADDRGMRLNFWLDDDPDYMIIHLTSDHNNLFLSVSTSWIVKAETLENKVDLLKTIKKDITKLLEE